MVRKAVKKVATKRGVRKGPPLVKDVARRSAAKVVEAASKGNQIFEETPFAPKPEAQIVQVGPKRRDDAFLYDYICEQNERLANAKVMAQEEELRDNNVMTQALAIIYGDREKTYGRPHINLESIAAFWSTYLQRVNAVRGTHDMVSIEDVCQMMVLLKMARLINDPTHKDSLVDEIGYIGLHERVQVR